VAENLVVVTDDLGRIELGYATIEFTVEHDDGRTENLPCRIFHPPIINGFEFGEFVVELLRHEAAAREGDDASFYRQLELMVWVHSMVPNKDRRKGRRFDQKSFERCESLRVLTSATRTRHAPLPEKLLAAAGDRSDDKASLFDGVVYEAPLTQIPLAEEEYEQFRDSVLDEAASFQNQLDEVIRAAVVDVVRGDVRGRGGKRLSRNRLAEGLKRFDETGGWEKIHGAVRKMMGQVQAETELREQQNEERFADLLEQVESLQRQMEEVAQHRGVAIVNGDTLTKAGVAVIESVLQPCVVTALLREMLLRIEQDQGLAPLEVYTLDELGVDTSFDTDAAPADEAFAAIEDDIDLPEYSVFQQYQQALTLAIANEDTVNGWIVLCQMRAQFVNRTKCMQRLQREAEVGYTIAMGIAADVVYRRIRKRLTREERRAFRLVYLPNPWLDGRVAATEPVARSFAMDMDEDTQRLLLGVLVKNGGNKESQVELRRRWNAFLRFYPHWLDMVRDDEREVSRSRRERAKGKFSSEWVESPATDSSMMASQFHALRSANLAEWVNKYCTATQATYLIGYFRDDLTEPEIAKQQGVTQQAVNKGIASGMERLKKGLVKDGIVEIEV
jgi:hypothetical protein